MPFTKVNAKVVLLFFIFAISTLFILYSGNNEKYPDNIFGNLSNKSMDVNSDSGDLIQNKSNNVSFGGTVIVYPGDSIQQKINNASSDSILLVYPGVYKENLVVNKSLTIISKEGKPIMKTVIQAADPKKDIFHVTADNVTISGFNITGAEGKAGIYDIGSNGNITGKFR
jgi:nitrous oxidase accessory protein